MNTETEKKPLTTEQKRLVRRWVRALRSGKYKQTASYLRRRDNGKVGHCCLGVLCDLVDPNGWKEKDGIFRHSKQGPNKLAGLGPGLGPEYPNRAVLRAVGLGPDEAETLATMNDDGDSFKKIARKIEQLTGVEVKA